MCHVQQIVSVMYEVTHLRQYCFIFPLLIFKRFQNLLFCFLALLDSTDLPKVGMFNFRGRTTVCFNLCVLYVLFK